MTHFCVRLSSIYHVINSRHVTSHIFAEGEGAREFIWGEHIFGGSCLRYRKMTAYKMFVFGGSCLINSLIRGIFSCAEGELHVSIITL